ncbi:MAG: riboflavin biosynthesis protein RibF [Alphaproteobacteria bacterium]
MINPAIYVLGNFDGVHLGHKALIAHARALGAGKDMAVAVLTFEPHPRQFFAPGLPPFRLTTPAQKAEFLDEAGADVIQVMNFDGALAAIPAQDFAEKILVECGAKVVVAGEDFRFGHDRHGDMERMAGWLKPHGVDVVALPPVRDAQGQRYAASTARALLQSGQVRAANAILGREWAIRGIVGRGDRRGQALGFPTANIMLGEYLRPQYGVYAIRARQHRRGESGEWIGGVANIGRRPTVGGEREWLEAHLFDFAADIYDQEWDIALVDFIRPERKFSGLDELRAAIAEDVAVAKALRQ